MESNVDDIQSHRAPEVRLSPDLPPRETTAERDAHQKRQSFRPT